MIYNMSETTKSTMPQEFMDGFAGCGLTNNNGTFEREFVQTQQMVVNGQHMVNDQRHTIGFRYVGEGHIEDHASGASEIIHGIMVVTDKNDTLLDYVYNFEQLKNMYRL